MYKYNYGCMFVCIPQKYSKLVCLYRNKFYFNNKMKKRNHCFSIYRIKKLIKNIDFSFFTNKNVTFKNSVEKMIVIFKSGSMN